MDLSAPSSNRNGSSKRKERHGFLMRVDRQFRNTEGSSYQVSLPPSNTVFRPPRVLSADLPPSGSNALGSLSPSGSRGPATAFPNNGLTFVINTVGSMKSGQRAGIKRAAEQLPLPLDENNPVAKRPRPRSTGIALTNRKLFRPSRPLQNSDQVDFDIWATVLSYCEPKFLLEARTINSTFYRLLSDRSTIWKDSRINHYGDEMPDLPISLTEQKYIDLLSGRGCQNSICHKEHTARVYWMFQVRLCADCFKQKTMRADDLPSHRRHDLTLSGVQDPSGLGKPLWELLPLARSDGRRYMRPRRVDEDSQNWDRGHHLRQFVFLKSAYAKLEAEYLGLVRTDPSSDAVQEWVNHIHTQTMKFMAEVGKIEDWYKEEMAADVDLQQTRIAFFEARARELSPPMESEILWKMAAFRRIIKVQNPPTDRSWKMLKDKILPYRSQAAQVEEFLVKMRRSLYNPSQEIDLFERLHQHRFRRTGETRLWQPEQKVVLQLGRAELGQCLANGVADEDLLLLCLKNVFEAYQRLSSPPTGLNFDGTIGPYRLSLDDARMIVEEVMENHIPAQSKRGTIVYQALKCRGCRRMDFVKTFSFTEAFEHMLDTHAKQVGEGLEFWRFTVPYAQECEIGSSSEGNHLTTYRFPWYTVPWPRCLPLVPIHQDIRGLENWHPEIDAPFARMQVDTTVSAFEGRRPRETGIAGDDFPANLVYAAQKLNGVWLDSLCHMKIALKYALDLYARSREREPELSMFTGCLETLQNVNPAIDLRFRCGVCAGEGRVYRNTRHVKYKISIENLLSHWDEKHKEGEPSWVQSLMQLPSESEILEQIIEADKKLQEEKEATKERTAEMPTNARKRPKLKGSVVMQARLAREAFDELFPRQGVGTFPASEDLESFPVRHLSVLPTPHLLMEAHAEAPPLSR